MKVRERWIAMSLVPCLLLLAACTRAAAGGVGAVEGPATIEHIDGTGQDQVILTEDAARRLDVATRSIRSAGSSSTDLLVPYGAVLFDPSGATWVYVNTEPLTYVREPVKVRRFKGHTALLSSGPPVGTQVVTVGAAELLGTEFEVGDE